MIVKIYLPYLDQIISNIDAYIKYMHRSNLIKFERDQDVTASDQQTVALLMLNFNLKNVQLVEQTKKQQQQQRLDYLHSRREMLLSYLAVKEDSELETAIANLQNEFQELAKSMQVHVPIDIEIDDGVYALLKSKNLIN